MKTLPALTSLPGAAVLATLASALLPACRIYVEKPATSAYAQPAPPPPAAGYANVEPPPPRLVRRPPPPPTGYAATKQPTPSTGYAAENSSAFSQSSGPAASCFDAAASPTPDCGQLQLRGTCAGVTYAQQKCSAYKEYFDPKVAADAVACLGALGARVCDETATNTCARSSLAKACVDTSLSQLCGIAASKCSAAQADCTSLLSGLNDPGKEKVASCIASGCTGGLAACVDGLLPSH